MLDLNYPPEQENVEVGSSSTNNRTDKKSRKWYTDSLRQQIYEALLAKSSHGRLKRDSTTIVANDFNVDKRVVQRIWKRVKECRQQGVAVDVRSRKKGNCGRKKIDLNLSRVSSIPLIKRQTIRSLAEALGVKRSTLYKKFVEGELRRHSSILKPHLKEENKRARVKFCVDMLDPNTLHGQPRFINMQNIVHIDEKWFYTSKKSRTFYMRPNELDPNRTIKNKNVMDKVMFLAAVARPRYDEEGNCTFDGKLGVWPFVRKEPAKRSSQNRSKGTLVTKSLKVDRDTMRRYLITKVLPSIVACWPRDQANTTIWIQQDNARTHVPIDDEEFRIAVEQTGLDIRLMNQHANSPDLNALDLGFFASLQSLTEKRLARNVDDLILNVQQAFHSYDAAILNKVFLTLQSCMLEVMKARGGNGYKIPHMHKERLSAVGNLPESLSCDRRLYESALETIYYHMSS